MRALWCRITASQNALQVRHQLFAENVFDQIGITIDMRSSDIGMANEKEFPQAMIA